MIQMPVELAEQGQDTLNAVLDWMDRSIEHGATDKNLSTEVILHLRERVKAASNEEIEIIMAWMYVGAVADQLMDRIRAQDAAKAIVNALHIDSAGPDLKGGA